MAVTDSLPVSNPENLAGGRRPPGRVSDRVFRWIALGAGLTVLVVLVLIIASTLNESWAWVRQEGFGSVFSDSWDPAHHQFGSLALLYGTMLVAFIALVLAVPVSVCISLFVTEVA
jgi:phosphate transport system permease protein